MSRRLMKEEGLLVGGSSGSTMVAALKVAKTMKEGETLVVLFADSVRNYMSKFLNDNWMIENGFLEAKEESSTEWWASRSVSDLKLQTPLTVSPHVPCTECLGIIKEAGYDQLPVVGDEGEVIGVVALGDLSSKLLSGRVKPTDPVSKVVFKQFKQVDSNTSLWKLSKIFDRDHFALVVHTQRTFKSAKQHVDKQVVFGVVTRLDLLNFIVENNKEKSNPGSPTSKL